MVSHVSNGCIFVVFKEDKQGGGEVQYRDGTVVPYTKAVLASGYTPKHGDRVVIDYDGGKSSITKITPR